MAAHHCGPGHGNGLNLARDHRCCGGRAAGDKKQIDVETIFLKKASFFGNPDRRESACLGTVADIHALELFLGSGES
jgi:hypothetical protein